MNLNSYEGMMSNIQISTAALRGLSFSIADLTLFGAWAEAWGIHMAVRLDHGSDTEEYEEVLAFHPEPGGPCRWMIWRDEQAVFVQPLPGRTQHYRSVADVMSALTPRQADVVTDIVASRWPQRLPNSIGGGRAV